MRVNGKTIQDPDHWVDLEKDRVTLDGQPLRPAVKTYILVYKPTGFVTTWRDPEGRPTVYHLVRDAGTWLSPVGRLDLETSGLLLMTNDTRFADRIMSPAHKVPKTYLVKVAALLSDEHIDRLRRGVELSDGLTRPAEVKRLRDTARCTFLEITLTEGRNRQVRRMIEAVGSKVLKLVRTAIGPIRIGDLAIGSWRRLTADEIQVLGGTGGPRTPGEPPAAKARAATESTSGFRRRRRP